MYVAKCYNTRLFDFCDVRHVVCRYVRSGVYMCVYTCIYIYIYIYNLYAYIYVYNIYVCNGLCMYNLIF